MSLRVESTVITPGDKSPLAVAEEYATGLALTITWGQYKPAGAEAYPAQVAPIVSVVGSTADLVTWLERAFQPTFAVVRTPTALAYNQAAMTAAQGTNIAASRAWSNNTVSPARSGVLFTPNGPLATAKPNYALLMSRLDV